MNFVGIVLLLGVVGLAGYLVFTLVRDIRNKVKDNKRNKVEKD